MRFATLTVTAALSVGAAIAQTPTAEDLKAKIDQRVEALNPYQALLNDPDPARSLAAIQVMFESGDPTLMRMALEFGLLSPNPNVRRTALEGMLKTQPVLTLRYDTTVSEDGKAASHIKQFLDGTVDGSGIGYSQITVGDYDPEKTCYLWRGSQYCAISINADGLFIQATKSRTMRGKLKLGADGRLIGSATIYQVAEPVPIGISLLE